MARLTTLLTIAYLAGTALLIGVLGRALPDWPSRVAGHLVTCAGLLVALRPEPLPRMLVVARDWHPLVLFPLLYREVEVLAAVMGDWRLTETVAATESALFSGQPSLYLSERLPFVPLSEYLHFCYLAYVIIIPALAAWWYVGGRRAAFHELVLLLAAVMYSSYLFFILFPVDSPYYRFDRLAAPLAGNPFFDLVHAMSARGGARGGAFPSAHVSGAVVVALVAWRHQRQLAVVLVPIVLGLIVATVYGRFHYAVDAIGGVGLALIVAGCARLLAAARQARGGR
jgi:membrane-associated phospholipid phosphatase